ncbi:hypothetical protein NUW54_g12609 [Trametes sanguinea]|uniref:Uncharacterized protein n=1 Tax=Trametes sanguinea TaxID=158606 RepID=A0ACC1MVF9_9APHY|nr:hypothetical protein NUW54_g12609 [Trametes sanguinea]
MTQGFAVMVLDKIQQLNDSIRERDEQQREFQERMLGAVRKLSKKVAEVQQTTPIAALQQGRATIGRRPRPSRSMASRIILEGGSSMSPRERQKAVLQEKLHLSRLQASCINIASFQGNDYKTMARLNPPLTDEDIKTYEESSTESYFAGRKFRIDFTRSWLYFPFNIEARDYFVQTLLRDFQGGSYKNLNIPARYINFDHIAAALDTYIEYCREIYRSIVKPPSKEKVERRKQRVRRNSRKNTMQSFVTRQAVLVDNGWDHHLRIFALLKAEDMSGDETDRDADNKKIHPPSFTIQEPRWSSVTFTEFRRKLDKWRHLDWQVPDENGAYKGGNGPRTRNSVGKIVNVRPPKGLYRNCYDENWLSTLKPHQYRSLRVIDEEYDFALPNPSDVEADHEGRRKRDDDAVME